MNLNYVSYWFVLKRMKCSENHREQRALGGPPSGGFNTPVPFLFLLHRRNMEMSFVGTSSASAY